MLKQTITAILILISVGAYAQPKKSDLSVTLTYKVVSDTLTGNIITYDKEGYLKKTSGKVIRKISVFDNQNVKPEITDVKYFLENWTAIKPEDVYDFKTVQK